MLGFSGNTAKKNDAGQSSISIICPVMVSVCSKTQGTAGSELPSRLLSRANDSHVKELVLILIYVLFNIKFVVLIRPEVLLA